ncbi:hypothetical protein [Myroides phaeus]|uniref:hypothetical protein n=1 Tax=Myroides phaeus TaxID=702745 RepID=UPI001303EEBF|nr:hypothetical protein [Myroides phaeus]
MKKILFSLVVIGGLLVSCSSDDNSSNENGTTVGGITAPHKVIRVLEKIKVSSTRTWHDGEVETSNSAITYEYENGKLVKIVTDRNEVVGEIKYNKGGIESISNIEDTFFLSEITGKKLDGAKYGKVNQIHKGNPVDLTFYSFDEDEKEIEGEFQTKISYDAKPFFAFHTLNTTGAIDLSKKTQIDFGSPVGAALSGINEANKLLPVNNITGINHIYGEKESFSATVTYEYDKEGYPVTAIFETVDKYTYNDWNRETRESFEVIAEDKDKGTVKFYFKEIK